jgi:peptide deformylase
MDQVQTALDKIIMLGDPRLYEVSEPVLREEVPSLLPAVRDLSEVLAEFKRTYGAGRAIAAPQIGVMKRIIFMNIDRPVAMFNPELTALSPEMFELWDDCMCFPNLLVRVRRHKTCTLTFFDETWKKHEWLLEDSLSELIQHEYDHLEGILATQRAIDDRSFAWR